MSVGRAIQVLYVANQKNHTVAKTQAFRLPFRVFFNKRYGLSGVLIDHRIIKNAHSGAPEV